MARIVSKETVQLWRERVARQGPAVSRFDSSAIRNKFLKPRFTRGGGDSKFMRPRP